MDDRTSDAHHLAREFLDDEYRRTWAEDYLNTSLALQIAALRKERQWNQSVLAAKAGTTQSAISRMEDVEYGAHSIRVLKQLADAFGLRLRVSFEEFGSLISESGSFSEDGLHRRSFWDDPVIAQLLMDQGLALPASPEMCVQATENETPDVELPAAGEFQSFEDEFASALFLPLPDLVKVFKKWLMGYGLPSADEPAYMRLYFSIPPDERNSEWSRRAAEACAEWLIPEHFEELLSDANDGERAVVNLLRLSAALQAGFVEIRAACRKLLSWLAGSALEDTVREALFDLVLELRDLEFAKLILAWPEEAGLTNRQRLKISSEVFKIYPKDPLVLKNLAASMDVEGRRDNTDPVVYQISTEMIRRSMPEKDAERDLEKSKTEIVGIGMLLANVNSRASEFAPQPG